MKSSFVKLLESRLSVRNFIEDIVIPKKDFNCMFELTSLSPSCFNLQHASYIVISDPVKKEEFYNKVCNQYKVKTASALIMVIGDIDAYKQIDNLLQPKLEQGLMSEEEYKARIKDVKLFYTEGRSKDFPKEEAIRNASLSAMTLMYVAKDMGYDTAPMLGFNLDKARKFFDLPSNLEPVLLIAIGKEDPNNKKIRDSRKEIDKIVTYY